MDVESQQTGDEWIERIRGVLKEAIADAMNQSQTVVAAMIDRATTEAGNVTRGALTDLTATAAPFSTELKRFNDNLEKLMASGLDVGGLSVSLGKPKP